MNTKDRIKSHVTRRLSGCWEWNGATNNRGYGVSSRGGRAVLAHRLAYETWVGPIPKGMVVNHLCENKCCVNPKHLEVTTNIDNLHYSQKDCCVRGHELSGSNIKYVRGKGRTCLKCVKERNAEHHRRTYVPTGTKRGPKPKAVCPQGHKMTPENTYVKPRTGHRECRECNRVRAAKKRSARATAA